MRWRLLLVVDVRSEDVADFETSKHDNDQDEQSHFVTHLVLFSLLFFA